MTILDDDGPTLTIDNVTVDEANTHAVFTVSLSFDPSHNVSFTWSTVNGTAVAPGDFTARSETVTITNGIDATLAVPVKEDSLDEINETLTVQISNVSGAIVTNGTGLGTITDDDDPPIVSIEATKAVTEGVPTSVTVSLNNPSGKTVTVVYETADGSGSSPPPAAATAPADYTAIPKTTLTFAPGETSKLIPLTIVADNTAETAEVFRVVLSSPGAGTATLGNATTVVTIAASS